MELGAGVRGLPYSHLNQRGLKGFFFVLKE